MCIFFNTSWTYLSAILVFMKKLLTGIQVVHHVAQDVEQVEHNSLSVSSISYNSAVVSLLYSESRQAKRIESLHFLISCVVPCFSTFPKPRHIIIIILKKSHGTPLTKNRTK